MKHTYLLLLTFFSLSIYAQPTITSTWVPTAGLTVGSTYFFSPPREGAAGAAATWDLRSTDTIRTLYQYYLDPATVPFSAAISGTTDVHTDIGRNGYNFDGLNGQVYQRLGVVGVIPGFDTSYSIFTDPYDYYHFPLTYQSSFIDTARLKVYLSDSHDTSTGITTETVTADGYGTLMTNQGTFTDALRIHRTSYTITNQISSGILTIDSFRYNEYEWLSPSHPGLVLADILQTNNLKTGSKDTSGYYNLTDVHTGISAVVSHPDDWSVTPQPAGDLAVVNIAADQSGQATLTIYDLTGRVVYTAAHDLSEGNNKIRLSTTQLPDDIYTLSISKGDKTSARKLAVRH